MRHLVVFLALAAASCGIGGGVFTIAGGVGESCNNDSNCRPGLLCKDAQCTPSGDRPQGRECFITDECAPGLYCAPDLKCAPAGDNPEGSACHSPAECERGLFCDLKGFSGTCREAGDTDLNGTCARHGDCLAGLACVSGKCMPPARILEDAGQDTCEPREGAFRALFEVPRGGKRPNDFYALPFPNDIRTKAGHVVVADHPTPGDLLLGVDVVKTYLEKIEQDVDGFGTNPTVYLRFSGEIDFESLTAGGPGTALQFVDLSNGDRLGMSFVYSTGRARYLCENHLAVRPAKGAVLKGGHTYAVIVTTDVKNAAGAAVAQDADFAAVIGEAAPSDPDLAAAHAKYAPLRVALPSLGLEASKVASAAVFTTQHPTRVMEGLREAVAADRVPAISDVTVCGAGVESPCMAGDEARACGVANEAFTEIHMKIELPIFQEGIAPYRTEGGRIGMNGAGIPQVVRREQVCAALTIPKGATMPAGGWPLVLSMHGTGGSFRSHVVDGTAQRLAAASPGGEAAPVPFAVLGFDAVLHGPRRGEATEHPNELVFNFGNPRAARDNWLQGAADALAVLRAARGLSLPTVAGAPVIDGTKVSFFGHSQGSTHGALFLAYAPDVKVAMLSGAGGLLIESLLAKTNPVDIAGAMQVVMLERLSAFHPVLSLFQTYFEASDPMNYALLASDPRIGRHVFLSAGVGDTYTPPKATENLGLAMGLSLANSPKLADFEMSTVAMPVRGNRNANRQTAVMQQYAPPDGSDGHFVVFSHPDARRRVAAWFATGLTDPQGVPTLVE